LKKITFLQAKIIGKRVEISISGKEFYMDCPTDADAKMLYQHCLELGKRLGFRDVLKEILSDQEQPMG
jgi:dimeric dUTPase (all-alpha-NTP-PPase superfamily)